MTININDTVTVVVRKRGMDRLRKSALAYQHKFRLTAFALAVVSALAVAQGFRP